MNTLMPHYDFETIQTESNLTFLLYHFNSFVKLTCNITKSKPSCCTFWPVRGCRLPLQKFVTLPVYFNAAMNFTFETTHINKFNHLLMCSNLSSISRISLMWWPIKNTKLDEYFLCLFFIIEISKFNFQSQQYSVNLSIEPMYKIYIYFFLQKFCLTVSCTPGGPLKYFYIWCTAFWSGRSCIICWLVPLGLQVYRLVNFVFMQIDRKKNYISVVISYFYQII